MWVFYFFILMVRNILFYYYPCAKVQFAVESFCESITVVTQARSLCVQYLQASVQLSEWSAVCLCLRVSKSAGFPLHPLKAHCSTGTEILADIQKCLPQNTCVRFPKCIPPGWLPRQDFARSSPGYIIPNAFRELLVCQPLKVSGRSDEDLDT